MFHIDSSSSNEDSEDEIPVFNLGLRSKKLKRDVILPPTITNQGLTLSSALDPGIDIPETYLSTFPHKNPDEAIHKMKKLALQNAIKKLSKKSVVCQPGFEKQFTIPPYLEGRRKIKRERIKERDKTTGPSWFNLPATEMTEEYKNDLMVLQMRKTLDPKRFYKRSSMKTLPKYFQVGTVIEPAIDFYHARVPKKQRKKTLVDELLADAEFRKFQKRKYTEAIKNQPQKVYHSRKKKKNKLLEAGSSSAKTKAKKNKKR